MFSYIIKRGSRIMDRLDHRSTSKTKIRTIKTRIHVKTQEKTILKDLLSDINQIKWSTKTVNEKAINFITNLFNHFVFKHKTLNDYVALSNQFWINGIEGKRSHQVEIKRLLVEHKILDVKDGLYNKDKRVKSFKFNNKYIYNFNINNSNYIILAVPFCKDLKDNELQAIENSTKNIIKTMSTVVCEKGTAYKINEIIDEIEKGTVVCEKGTVDVFIDYNIDGVKMRGNYNSVFMFAESLSQLLIKYNNKFYITNNIDEFKKYKRNELSLLYSKQLFDIHNNIIYVKRNDTNNRLDSNLTNLKSELWQFLRLDNEEILEIDIVNSQFAILSNLMKVDDLFYELATTGKLYEYVANKLKISRKEAKNKMFRVAFDKVKSEQDDIRKLFPITMKNIDQFKRDNGYKMFSNLLQKTEANVMIDNVLFELQKEFDVVSVHDSIRCKVSDYDKVLTKIQNIFNNIEFKCTIKNKNKQEKTMITQEYKNIIIEEMINQNIICKLESTHIQSKPIIDKFIDKLFNTKHKIKRKELKEEFENFMLDYNSKINKEPIDYSNKNQSIKAEMIEEEIDEDEMWY
jgi:hypothetical protein